MFGSAKKVPTTCPHCGNVQLEPRELISTYCRGCGDHFTVATPPPVPLPTTARPALAERLRGTLTRRQRRTISCHDCGHPQPAPAHSLSTHCPACGSSINLHDIVIGGHSTRVVQTRGTLHVGRDGFLNSTSVNCGEAFVEGRIAGKFTCGGTLRLRGEGLCRAQIRTRRLLVDRGASLRFNHTIYTDDIVIRGVVEADIECGGSIRVGRHGCLEGDVLSRSLIVDKGGRYRGAVEISSGAARPALLPPSPSDVRVVPGWQTRLSFRPSFA